MPGAQSPSGPRPVAPAGSTASWALALLAAVLLFARAGAAQGPPGGVPDFQGMSREEWIKKVEADIRVNEERRRAEIQALRQQAQEAQKQALGEAQRSPADLTLKNVSEVAVVFFQPADAVVEEGALCATGVMIRCRAQRSFNTVELVFSFDPAFLRPVTVYDDELRPLAAEAPMFETDVNAGLIRYSVRLVRPMGFFSQRLLTIVWKALKPVDSTVVDLQTPDVRSSIRLGAKDILTEELLPRGGLIPLGLSIVPRASNVKQGFLPPGPAAAYAIPYFSKGQVWLELAGPDQPVPAGEEFDVRVLLHNPDQTLFDTLSLWIRFPPQRVEILDWDRGNWIRMGVNIHDAPAHGLFPFDFHLANEVVQETGEIFYRMGVTHTRASSEGLVAEIRARALAPASVHDFQFAYGPPGGLRTTEVSFLGAGVLSGLPEASASPAPVAPAELPPAAAGAGF